MPYCGAVEHTASRTAYAVALRRAVHQQRDRPLVLDDPLALRIVDAADLDRVAGTALRAFVVARSRFAEDVLAEAVRDGVRQYVVLGAGLDTFACRNPYGDLRVFEVDHPLTQRRKRERLRAAGIGVPATATFAPIDFEREALADALSRAGFHAGEPAAFSWLGVTPYLTRAAAQDTIAFVGRLPARTRLVFDYAPDPSTLSGDVRVAFDALARRVAAAGEPFQTFFDPDELAQGLRRAGFSAIEDLGPEAINARYFAGRADGLRVAGAGRLLRAEV